jgi:hypothetical protein
MVKIEIKLSRRQEHKPPPSFYGSRSPPHVPQVTEDIYPLDRRVGRSGVLIGRSDRAAGIPAIDYGPRGIFSQPPRPTHLHAET